MLDIELLSAFTVFFKKPAQEGGAVGTIVGWRMVYSIMQVLAEEGSTIEEVRR